MGISPISIRNLVRLLEMVQNYLDYVGEDAVISKVAVTKLPFMEGNPMVKGDVLNSVLICFVGHCGEEFALYFCLMEDESMQIFSPEGISLESCYDGLGFDSDDMYRISHGIARE